LRDCEETGGGWKYLATTSIVIDALDEVSRTDLTSGAVKWLLTKQNPDGSWGRGEKMVNTTAMALASLKGKREHA
jgi:squalene cyclase